MRTYHPPRCAYSVKDGRIEADGTVMERISGTKLGAILGKSPYSTPFQAACALLGLASEQVSDRPAVKTGVALEDKIIRYVSERYGSIGVFMSAEEMFEKREGAHSDWKSDFENEVFSGHVDGMVFTEAGETCVLEVKTTSNLALWAEGVPEHYYWQVALYNRFVAHADKAYIALGIVNENTYRDPGSWVPNDSTVMLFEVPMDEKKMDGALEEAAEWYRTYILNAVTPEPDALNERDMEMYNHLLNLAESVDAMRENLSRLAELNAEIEAIMDTTVPLTTERDTLRNRVKNYMVSHGLSALDTPDGGWKATVRAQKRTSVDPSLLVKAGIDPKPFTVETETKIFTVKRSKEE